MLLIMFLVSQNTNQIFNLSQKLNLKLLFPSFTALRIEHFFFETFFALSCKTCILLWSHTTYRTYINTCTQVQFQLFKIYKNFIKNLIIEE